MLTSGVLLLHDKVPLHTATCNQPLLKHITWDLSDTLFTP